MLIDGYQLGRLNEARRFVVVSTQGKGDEAALRAAVSTDAAYHAFVGSRRKMAALREKLIGEGIDAAALDRIKAPAGLDLGAITPEEIAMSILAEITLERRRGQRAGCEQVSSHSDHRVILRCALSRASKDGPQAPLPVILRGAPKMARTSG